MYYFLCDDEGVEGADVDAAFQSHNTQMDNLSGQSDMY